EHADRVQYLGGDLMHAGRVHDRLGGRATSYQFSRQRDAARFGRVFGALAEADGRFGDGEIDAARDGILLFPGSRKNEVAHATPMFVRIAVQIRRRLPGVPIAFARSPFTADSE